MKLSTWLSEEALSFAEFAPRIDRTAEAVRRYANGERIPDRDTMPKIVRETGGRVTANDFFDVADHVAPDTQNGSSASPGKTGDVTGQGVAA